MKKIKKRKMISISLGLVAAGILSTVPFISTGCSNLNDQTIAGDDVLNGTHGILGSSQYLSSASTKTTWDVKLKNGDSLPGLTIGNVSGKLHWDDIIESGTWEIVISAHALNFKDATHEVILNIANGTQNIESDNRPVFTYAIENQTRHWSSDANTTKTWTATETGKSELPTGFIFYNGNLTFDGYGSDVGQYSITMTCKAPNYNDKVEIVTITIQNGYQSIAEGGEYLQGAFGTSGSYTYSSSAVGGNKEWSVKMATWPDDEPVPAPEGVTMNPNTGALSWTNETEVGEWSLLIECDAKNYIVVFRTVDFVVEAGTQTINGDDEVDGYSNQSGFAEYESNAITTQSWSVASTDDTDMPEGIEIDNAGKLTWPSGIDVGEYSLTITCRAENYNTQTFDLVLNIQ
ncbi:MAG: hypothetical protein LBT17_03865 [Mycoplasmataceae bacterium]|nr:hypothetical protein [Mycoplasmataceae bacterium]